MLKAAPNGRQPPSATRNLLANATYQMPANPMPTSRTPAASSGSGEKWQAYVNGGAAADDAQFVLRAKEEAAKYLEFVRNTPPAASESFKPSKLIEVSPVKKAISRNANLLIDLDLGLGTAPEPSLPQPSWVKTAS
jgi:helicase required for RNAi-mediated heterochromatin assembly 1